MLEDLKKRLTNKQVRLGEALAEALPAFRGKITDECIMWLASEMQGYQNASDWYQRPTKEFPAYRIVKGELGVMDREGNLGALNHPLAQRQEFFIGAPIAWLEDSATLPGHITMVEMQELNAYMGKFAHGTIVCRMTKDSLLRILENFRLNLIRVIEEVTAAAPQ